MAVRNCKDCMAIQAELDIRNLPQADSDAPDQAYTTGLAALAIKRIRRILSGKD